MTTGTGKYSYFCKHCGYSYMSDSKSEVSDARKTHKIVEKKFGIMFKYCPVVPLDEKRGLYARPELALIMLNR